jgi:hypothetical protein
MSRNDPIRREHGRIYFGEGADRWSVNDPDDPRLADRLGRMSAESDFLPRDVITDYLYLVYTCPTTSAAQAKLAAIRLALRTVPSPWEMQRELAEKETGERDE